MFAHCIYYWSTKCKYTLWKTFFFLLSLAFHARKKKRCQWVQKALKSHMKIENITSVHNYFMLHITCSTKSQMTLFKCTWHANYLGGRMYWNRYLNVIRGSLHTRPGQSLSVFKMNRKWDVTVIMGVSAFPPCDADFKPVLKHWILSCTFFLNYAFWVIWRSQFWFNVPFRLTPWRAETILNATAPLPPEGWQNSKLCVKT